MTDHTHAHARDVRHMNRLDTDSIPDDRLGHMDTLRSYTLTATYRGKTVAIRFMADDDNDATWTAIGQVLERACPKVGSKRTARHTIWARGLIVLTDEVGNEVRRMEEKVA